MLDQWIIGTLLILSSLGVVFLRNPVHSSLSFLLTLLSLAVLYLQLSAQFISVMQVLVYAGAILVIFMFVIILFQDAHQEIEKHPALSSRRLITVSLILAALSLLSLGKKLEGLTIAKGTLPADYGTVEGLGKLLYIDFFFPFEAVLLLFLIAMIGALYTGRKVS